MAIPKYACLENERRFLLAALPNIDLDEGVCTHISDLYIEGSRMRLRSIMNADGSVAHKLCKKYPTEDPYSGAIVNIYLSPSEHGLLETLSGKMISKRRYRVIIGEEPFSLDVFEDQLEGLILCEAERPTRMEVCSLRFPAWATIEVTEDDFFTGGHLAQVSSDQLREKISSLNTLVVRAQTGVRIEK